MVGQTSKLGNSSAAVGPRRMLLKSGKAGITALVVAFVAALAMGAPTAALAQSFPAAVTNISPSTRPSRCCRSRSRSS